MQRKLLKLSTLALAPALLSGYTTSGAVVRDRPL